jgi:hypothetical protein
MIITLQTEDADSFYARKENDLRAEIRRVRLAPTRTPERSRLVGRLISAIREIQRVREHPEEFTWRYYTARISRLRLASVAACVLIGAFAAPEAFRRGNEWSPASVLFWLAFAGAIASAVISIFPLSEGLDRRRRLHAALRLAERTQSGKRRPRGEAFDAPFVGPPAADILVLTSIATGTLMSRSGLRLEGAMVGLFSMLAFVVALAQRRRIRLALPFTNRRAKPFSVAGVLTGILFTVLADGTRLNGLVQLGIVVLGLTFLYVASVGLAEEALMAKPDIERDEEPTLYWLLLLIFLAVAFGLVGTGLVLSDTVLSSFGRSG